MATLIGQGNCAHGAYRIMTQLRMEITVYDRATVVHLRDELDRYDVIVNAVLWDVFRKDHLISRSDLARVKPGAMIIDISCDEGMGGETCHATPIYDPVYTVDGIIHYAVDHTPALYYRTATESISRTVARYLDELVESRASECLSRATVIEEGRIGDQRIARFQNRLAQSSGPITAG